jgi:phosphate acetyltransferase
MAHPLLTVPASHKVGLTSISLGLVRCLDRHGINVGFYKPVAQLRYGPRRKGDDIERSTGLIRATTDLNPPAPLASEEVERLLSRGAEDELEQHFVSVYQTLARKFDALVIEGLVPTDRHPFAARVNQMIAKALDAEVILIVDAAGHDPVSLAGDIRIAADAYGSRVCGAILNRVPGHSLSTPPSLSAVMARAGSANQHRRFTAQLAAVQEAGVRPLGAVPFALDFVAVRVSDVAEQLGATAISEGKWNERRVRDTRICAMRVEHAQPAFTTHGCLVVVPSDRADILIGAALATLSGTELAGILLSGSDPPAPSVLEFCGSALATGLPVLQVADTTYNVVRLLHELNDEIPPTDRERASLVMNTVANHIETTWVTELSRTHHAPRLSPAAFRHRLVEQARAADAVIVLPEGTEPRILSAAHVCLDMGIARPILLGSVEEVRAAARQARIDLAPGIQIRSPLSPPEDYVERLIELRRHKGLDTREKALDALSDVTMFGTMMMKMGDADGLVSGAVHSTAHTIRPALSIIKTRPGANLVSSVFFMCLPEQVLVFGDCAVNPNPDAEQLADIAIQSAESAAAFGIIPRVAMISYSTGSSGSGSDVDKVRQATLLAQAMRPDLPIDGPLQYDAAVNQEVAKTKAPDSPVAGQATVLVFPDLNTGNTTYKAVQRSANVLSIGPMLQGLAAPVNDLSRGATVDDIVYTIALTAVQVAAGRRLSLPPPGSIKP